MTADAHALTAADDARKHVAAAEQRGREEVQAERDAERSRADDLNHEIVNCDRLDLLTRAEAAEAALAGFAAKIEALADEWGLVQTHAYQGHATRLRALIPADAATALDAVKAEAKAEERERIAQAIETHLERPYTADYRDGLRGAARIARHTPEATS